MGLQRSEGLQEHSKRSIQEQEPWSWGWGAQVRGEVVGSRGEASEFPKKSLAVPCSGAPCFYSLGTAARSVRMLFIFPMPSVFLGGREEWDSLQAVPNVFPWSRLRFRCSCAAPDAFQRHWQGWARGSPDPDGSHGAGITSGWGWKGLGVAAASRGNGAVPEHLCCFPVCSVCMSLLSFCPAFFPALSHLSLFPHLLCDHLECCWFFIPFWILSHPTPHSLYFPSTQAMDGALILFSLFF